MRVFQSTADDVETNQINQRIEDLQARVESLRGYL